MKKPQNSLGCGRWQETVLIKGLRDRFPQQIYTKHTFLVGSKL